MIFAIILFTILTLCSALHTGGYYEPGLGHSGRRFTDNRYRNGFHGLSRDRHNYRGFFPVYGNNIYGTSEDLDRFGVGRFNRGYDPHPYEQHGARIRGYHGEPEGGNLGGFYGGPRRGHYGGYYRVHRGEPRGGHHGEYFGGFRGEPNDGLYGRYNSRHNFLAPSYNFGYGVNDPRHGTNFGHQENRRGDRTDGEYYVRLPDGRLQKVSYYADELGYHPTITYLGKSRLPKYGAISSRKHYQ